MRTYETSSDGSVNTPNTRHPATPVGFSEIEEKFEAEAAQERVDLDAFEAKCTAEIIEAVRIGNISVIQNSLGNITEVMDANQNNLVMLAVLHRQFNIFKYLLSKKPNSYRYTDHLFDGRPSWDLENKKNKDGETVLTLTHKIEDSLKRQFTKVINDRSFFRKAANSTKNVIKNIDSVKEKIKTQCCEIM